MESPGTIPADPMGFGILMHLLSRRGERFLERFEGTERTPSILPFRQPIDDMPAVLVMHPDMATLPVYIGPRHAHLRSEGLIGSQIERNGSFSKYSLVCSRVLDCSGGLSGLLRLFPIGE